MHDDYAGQWYEVGKIQTPGGAFFQRDCFCTELGVTILDDNTGDGQTANNCRSGSSSGQWKNITGKLYDEDPAHKGHWLQAIGTNSVNYTVIAISGKDYAVEYDCTTSSLGITNYCIHVVSRTRSLNQSTFDNLIKFAEGLGLNPQNLPVEMTRQGGC